MQIPKLVIFILALIAMGIGIYAILDDGSNSSTDLASNTCPNTLANAKQLDALVKGEIAAFQIASSAKYIGDQVFNDSDGNQKSLAEWKGRTVLLNLWATWCAPCRHEMPALENLEKAEGGNEFQVVPVSVDLGEPHKPKNFYTEINLTALPFFHDGTMAVFNNLKKATLAFGMPSTLLLDKNSCVLGQLSGPAEWASDDAIKLIQAAKQLKN